MKYTSLLPLLTCAGAVSLAGCQIPAYQLPGGFSSTYHRQLFGYGPMVPEYAESSPETLPSELSKNEAGVFYRQTFQYAPPTKSPFQQAVVLPNNRPVSNRRNRRL